MVGGWRDECAVYLSRRRNRKRPAIPRGDVDRLDGIPLGNVRRVSPLARPPSSAAPFPAAAAGTNGSRTQFPTPGKDYPMKKVKALIARLVKTIATCWANFGAARKTIMVIGGVAIAIVSNTIRKMFTLTWSTRTDLACLLKLQCQCATEANGTPSHRRT